MLAVHQIGADDGSGGDVPALSGYDRRLGSCCRENREGSNDGNFGPEPVGNTIGTRAPPVPSIAQGKSDLISAGVEEIRHFEFLNVKRSVVTRESWRQLVVSHTASIDKGFVDSMSGDGQGRAPCVAFELHYTTEFIARTKSRWQLVFHRDPLCVLA